MKRALLVETISKVKRDTGLKNSGVVQLRLVHERNVLKLSDECEGRIPREDDIS